MRVRKCKRMPLGDLYPITKMMTISQLIEFGSANDITIEISKGKAYAILYDIMYDPEEIVYGI